MTDTNKAPERVHLYLGDLVQVARRGYIEDGHIGSTDGSGSVEYVRADLYAALLAERDAARALLAVVEQRVDLTIHLDLYNRVHAALRGYTDASSASDTQKPE